MPIGPSENDAYIVPLASLPAAMRVTVDPRMPSARRAKLAPPSSVSNGPSPVASISVLLAGFMTVGSNAPSSMFCSRIDCPLPGHGQVSALLLRLTTGPKKGAATASPFVAPGG